ncbi:BPTI/Kunitz domain-containing protein 4-like [Crassostrea angulata]|uniref:BPTI/Kunitz domain-containing protein 4-like n=1 Tax=Magallana angulata TaxID=2784310 RepID=UPI0022B10277|nr:BPTI/Kunitz domain-containing protein 4-like [Crassostrea angulata]
MNGVLCILLGSLCLLQTHAANLDAVLCGPVCMIWCPFGNVMDERGCPTCRCRSEHTTTTEAPVSTGTPKVCAGVMCDIYCPQGHTLVDGCPVCACKTDDGWVG